MPVGLISYLLILVAIVAGLVFLVVLGAIALWSALAVIAVIAWIVRLPARLFRFRTRRRLRKQRAESGQQPTAVDDDLLSGHVAGEIRGKE